MDAFCFLHHVVLFAACLFVCLTSVSSFLKHFAVMKDWSVTFLFFFSGNLLDLFYFAASSFVFVFVSLLQSQKMIFVVLFSPVSV